MQKNVLVRGATLAASVVFAVAIVAPAQNFTTLATFNVADGSSPGAPLVEGLDGRFYGTTTGGGPSEGGTIFRISPRGELTTLYTFCNQPGCIDGSWPQGLLVEDAHRNFYGTTVQGGTANGGTIFRISADGTLTTLYNFPCVTQSGCSSGDNATGLIRGTDGNFYGTTQLGGANGYGTVFKSTPAGEVSTLYDFCSQINCGDGQEPLAGLVQGMDGNFYGTTASGGNGWGTFFKIGADGELTTLYRFCSQANCTDGNFPLGPPVQGLDGNLYGVTYGGPLFGPGTVYRITTDGTLNNLYTFCSLSNCADGKNPIATLVLGTDGNFYGTTESGGTDQGCGTVFRISPQGKLTTLHTFTCNNVDLSPPGWLVQGTDGALFGTISGSGANGFGGTVFRLGVGLAPFVKTVYTSGKPGAIVRIVGNDLRGTKAVRFNGIPAEFKVLTRYEITTAVPMGASTGTVTVVTPRGVLASNVVFTVLP